MTGGVETTLKPNTCHNLPHCRLRQGDGCQRTVRCWDETVTCFSDHDELHYFSSTRLIYNIALGSVDKVTFVINSDDVYPICHI
jgi:hypothetical protein